MRITPALILLLGASTSAVLAAATRPGRAPARTAARPATAPATAPATPVALGRSMFHAPGAAKKIVFVCDGAGTMINKFRVLRRELKVAIDSLAPDQWFNVILFYDGPRAAAVDPGRLLAASPEHKAAARKFLDDFTTTGQADPVPALKLAFSLEPDLVYLVHDTHANCLTPPSELPGVVAKLNPRRAARVNTMLFALFDKEFEQLLTRIARDSGGQYRYVSPEDVHAP